VSQIALQTSIAITRIARYDYPTAWPTLFDELTRSLSEAHAVQSSSAQEAERDQARLRLLRGADVLQRVLKELGTVRLLAGKIRMTEVRQAALVYPSASLNPCHTAGKGISAAAALRVPALLRRDVSVVARLDVGGGSGWLGIDTCACRPRQDKPAAAARRDASRARRSRPAHDTGLL
jgi:hypothetical protein